MISVNLQPKSRTWIRILLGKYYYRSRRILLWTFGRIKFAKNMEQVPYPYTYISHSTPLLRQLKDVDMVLQYNKVTNLELATHKLNNIIINPGETFSYWKLIG